MELKVFPIEFLLERAKHSTMVLDRVPPMFGVSPSLAKMVEKYRELMHFQQTGVKLVKMVPLTPDVVVGFNQPYGEYYIWYNRFTTWPMFPVKT